jgi:copper chaperone
LFLTGVESFDIDLKEQKVTVKGNVKPQEVFETVSKTGKKTEFWVESVENKHVETAAEIDNKPSELAAIASAESDTNNKPLEDSNVVSVESDNKSSETVTVVA